MDALRGSVLALLLALPAAAPAAGPAPVPADTAPAVGELEELDEVEIRGVRKNRKPSALISWLRRLVGQYRYEGYVDLRDREGGQLGRQPVRGASDCVPFGEAPGVLCSMQVVWPQTRGAAGEEIPGGVSTLLPAMILYGMDPDYLAIHYLHVDNRGMGDSGHGYLYGDTLRTKMPCTDLPGKCERVTSITAEGDGRLVQMQIDINQDEVRVVRYLFALHRVSGAIAPPRK